jgi:predicted dehydrogenase
MTERVRYGVLSTAQIARNAHIPAAKKADNAEIVAISSRDKDRAVHWADELEIPTAYGSYDALLSDPDIDAVINPLPNSMHCEWTIKAFEAGKHVLCEKPLAVTVAETKRMIAAADANGVLLMEGFTPHFTPIPGFLRDAIAAGEIGEIKIVRSELLYTIQDWENDSRVQENLAGGALLDAGCYCVNMIRTVMGEEPLQVSAFAHVRPSLGVDTTFAGLLHFPDERVATMATGMEEPFRFTLEVVGTEGSLYTENVFAAAEVVIRQGGDARVVTFESLDRFQKQLEHFSDCILHGRAPRISTDDSLHNTEVLVALRSAAESGKVVAL